MKTLISGLFLAVLLSLLSTSLYAQTEDGETPAEESVCDVLADGTPGLFGLCNAYCEAEACHTFADGAQPASCDALLRNYNRLADGDPGMPCAVECPCWDADTLTAGGASPDGTTVLPGATCREDVEPLNQFDVAVYSANLDDVIWFLAGENILDGSACVYLNSFDPLLNTVLPTTPTQDEKCRSDIHALHLADFFPQGQPCPTTW